MPIATTQDLVIRYSGINVNRYGSTSQYLESIGFTLQEQQELQSILLH